MSDEYKRAPWWQFWTFRSEFFGGVTCGIVILAIWSLCAYLLK